MAKKSKIKPPTGSLRRGSIGKAFVWVILVLLVIGLMGFGANGVGGRISSIGSVGDTDISTGDFFRGLQQELTFETRRRGSPVSIQQARVEGIDQRVLDRLAATAALTEEADTVQLSVGDDEVASQLRAVPAFQRAGGFNRDAYEFALRQEGLRPVEFEQELRNTAARNILQQAITGGLTVPQTYAKTLYGYLQERRSFRWAPLDAGLVEGDIAEPTDAELQSFYDDNADTFLTPETRKLTFALLTPEMMLSQIEIDEDALRGLYEDRSARYNQPERRLVERLGFSTAEEAAAAKAAVEAGETTFEALLEERGLSLSDADQGAVARDDLDGDIADAIWALPEPGLTDPVQTSLGPVLYRVNALLDETSTSFEDARPELELEYSADQARRAIQDEIEVVDDLLVGGATLEELVDETPMRLDTLDFTAQTRTGIAAYDEFRAEALRMTSSDFPEVRELEDGSIYALRIDDVVAPTVPPLTDIRDAVADAWRQGQRLEKLEALGQDLAEQIRGGTRMATLDLAARAERDLTRGDFIDDAPADLVADVFGLETGDVTFVLAPDGRAALVELLDISPADMTTEQAQAVTRQFNDSASNGLAADVFELFGQTVQNRHGLSLDPQAVNAVLSQFGTGGGQHGGGF